MAKVPCEVSADARQDLVLHYDWYAREAGVPVAERYLDAFRSTLELLAMQPGLGVLRKFRHPKLRGVRSYPMLSAFRVHLVFYRMEDEGLVVFRVLHGMRDLPRRLVQPPGAED